MSSTIGEIAAWLGLPPTTHSGRHVVQLAHDSRTLNSPDGTLFFALRTKADDGHRFISDLYKRGVRNFVVDHIPTDMLPVPSDVCFLIVPDTLKALQQIGRECRKRFRGIVTAITGSRGKTTLKEWIFQLMEPLKDISRSPRSFNSQIGVPLSLWSIRPDSQLAIIEVGVSATGDMEKLRDIINPDILILTNIGREHEKGFASLSEKATEKVNLALAPSCRAVIFAADSPLMTEAISTLPTNRKRFGWSLTDPKAWLFINCPELPAVPDGKPIILSFNFNGHRYTLRVPLRNSADVENMANALAFMLVSGVQPEVAIQRFETLRHIDTRLNVSEGVNGCSVVYDSYTSDFSSLTPALDFVLRRAMPSQRLTLILSDPRHEASDATLYNAMAELVKRAGIKRFIGVGPGLSRHKELFAPDALFFDSTDSLMQHLSPSDFDQEIILLKGAPDFEFGRISQMLEARTHETVLEVNLDSITKNYNYFRRQLPQGTGVICMVKASGYGAGSREIAKTLQDAGAAYLAVAVLDEGIDLRENGITMPIMVMNPKVVNYKAMFAYHLEPEIYSLEMLGDVIREAHKNGINDYPVHIKLDTGMHRMGFIESEISELLKILTECHEIKVSSVFSHLATADEPAMDDYTLMQLHTFDRLTGKMLATLPYSFRRHILNSAGILRFPQYHYDMVRLGIGLYGVNTLPPDIEQPLAVVSTLRTVIIALRQWEPGTTIGYGRHGKITRPSLIATIPIGYADGMNRHFGRGAISVRVNGHDAPTIGNICMDACMIDVTGIECKVGDYVEIFGNDTPIQRLADTLGTIPYEVLTSVSPRVKRVYYRE
ncbi:MAG: bifunctional UDP-N-acetylmuramoyl-tripeptide:D-alanyl-D-alanine ligase/alanine racemase [Muribaculaceae bacterium]|nr:bifunctional UDP-N-acetylmuramoyl-tripeptide:D-alanyl-D-alanine ligase/alanine racemase [Muribaculaceae bacterium]